MCIGGSKNAGFIPNFSFVLRMDGAGFADAVKYTYIITSYLALLML